MAIFATAGDTDRKPKTLLPGGNYPATCYQMIEVGTETIEYMGESKKQKKVRLYFELPGELFVFREGEPKKPFSIDMKFTLSMYERASLRHFIGSWRGKPLEDKEADRFDVSVLVGKACLLTIGQELSKRGTTYNKIMGVGPLVKGMVKPNPINPQRILSYDNFNRELFMSLPEFIRDEIAATPEYQALNSPAKKEIDGNNWPPEQENAPDDLPF